MPFPVHVPVLQPPVVQRELVPIYINQVQPIPVRSTEVYTIVERERQLLAMQTIADMEQDQVPALPPAPERLLLLPPPMAVDQADDNNGASAAPAPSNPEVTLLPPPPQEWEDDLSFDGASQSSRMATDKYLLRLHSERGDQEADEQESERLGKKRRYRLMSDWPAEWRAEYDAFKAEESVEGKKGRWRTWNAALRRQVEATVAEPYRSYVRQWNREEVRQRQSQQQQQQQQHPNGAQQLPSSDPSSTLPSPSQADSSTPIVPSAVNQQLGSGLDQENHNWMRGARIGEAQNPGPPNRGSYRQPGSHAPRQSSSHVQAPARQRGARAASQVPAGEFAKRIYLGPNPGDDRRGNRPVGTGVVDSNFTNMIPHQPSRPGSAQGNHWQQVRSSREKRMEKEIEYLQRRLEELRRELRRQEPGPRREQQRQPNQPGWRGDDNRWRPLGRAAGRSHTSIGLQQPSRRKQEEPRREGGRE